jgi:hypothetical protein
MGPGALMAKFDVKAAYRNIPINPDDRYLLGMKLAGTFLRGSRFAVWLAE